MKIFYQSRITCVNRNGLLNNSKQEESSYLTPKISDGEKVVVEDNFVCSNWRTARLETENNALKRFVL